MFETKKEGEVFFVRDNTIGDVYLYLRDGDFEGGPHMHYLFSLVDRRMKAVPSDIFQMTYRITRDLGLKKIETVNPRSFYVSMGTKALFQVSNRVMTNNFPEEYAIVGSFISVARKTESIPEHDFIRNFKEVTVL